MLRRSFFALLAGAVAATWKALTSKESPPRPIEQALPPPKEEYGDPLTAVEISHEFLRRFKRHLHFARTVRTYKDEMELRGRCGKLGDTIRIRQVSKFEPILDGLPYGNITENAVHLTIDRAQHVSMHLNPGQLYLPMAKFANRYLEPAAWSLANAVDVNGLTMAYRASQKTVRAPHGKLQAREALYEAGAPFDNLNELVMSRQTGLVIAKDLSCLRSGAAGLAYDGRAFALAMTPLEIPRGGYMAARSIDVDSGLSTRLCGMYDVMTAMIMLRFDVAYGWAAPNPDLAVRIIS